MRITVLALLSVALLVSWSPTEAFARRNRLCATDNGAIYSKRRCRRIDTTLDIDSLAAQLGNTCTACGTDLSGDWRYRRTNFNNESVYFGREITFTQSGRSFEGTNAFHTIRGNVEGNWIRLTQVVSGEESEGFVLLAEGNLYQAGNFLIATLAIVAENATSTPGGSLVLTKQLN